MVHRENYMNLQDISTVIEHIPAVVFRFSHEMDDWRTWFVTRNISMYGYTAEEFMNNTVRWMDIVHPDDRVLVSKTIGDYEKHGINSFKLYYRLVKKNGDSVPVTEYNTVNRDENGAVVCYDTVIFNNVQADDKQRIIDAHYRQQVVLNDILMSLHDSDLDHALQIILDRTGAYLDTSRALLFKDSPDHVTCKIVYEWCNQDIESVMALDYSIAYETGMPEIYIALQTTGNLLINYGQIPDNCKEEFEAEGLIASAIFAVYLGGEHYGFVCFDDCVIERNWDDDTARFLKNIANIISTVLARQEAAEQLAQNQRTYEAVLNNVDSYIFVTDIETAEIIFANRAFCHTFGDDCIGTNANVYFDLDSALAAQPEPADADRSGSGADYPEVFCPRSTEWLSVSAEQITWVDGKPVRLVNCYDITAKKHFSDTLEERIKERTRELLLMTESAEEARARAEDAATAKARFLANMSHEMRTPMNAIIGMANIYKTAADPARKDYCLDKIEEASIHLLGVINDILDMSKIDAGKMELSFSEFNFEKMLMRVTSVLNYSIGQKEQVFRVKTDDRLPVYLISDEQRISQVITNLLSNAVKFTPEKGEISLNVRLQSEAAGQCVIEVTVKDNGIGISPEQLSRLFRAFEQADSGISRRFGGTGLGLAISSNIAGLLDGDIVAASAPGEGSSFTFTFTARIGSGTVDAVVEKVAFDRIRTLVVDDASDVRDYFMHLSQLHGFACEAVSNGEKACQLIKQAREPYHIIFVDWNMPGMTGIEVAREIQEYSDSIVILISAFEWSEIEHEAKAVGVERFLPKPLYPSTILETIQQCTSRKAARAAENKNHKHDFSGRHILLAEDVMINREIVLALLKPTGVVIDCAATGTEAVSMFAENGDRYDLVFMDIHMPEMDGYEATRQIRAMGTPKALETPIIAMTANVFREDIEKCLACGMDDHIGKPLDMTDLFGRLERYL